MHFPTILIFLFTIIDLDLGNTTAVISITIALFPALDPLPVMLIIKNYRNVIFRKLAKLISIVVGPKFTTKDF
ncbi:unnamed protein product [Caenorhabditis angaria]|uniref:7TM GPCR serpentine receptor class x (Srx) domain-containing protein n=1 Tax=Caenorhabditis angaria TaxID=860376 RepID=A0A9P1IIT5_9PELO|nr:unnamed protein product [Caenorhabditis angaria]